jgi:type I restriction enzyme S subunit
MKIGKVSCQDIRIVMRLDGSFHLAEANIYEKTILKREHRLLDSFCDDIFTSGRSKRFYTTKERGYPYLSNSDVIAQNPFASCKYYSRKYAYDDDALLKKGMILTGRVGAIGQTAYVTDEFEEKKAMGSDNIIRIVPKKNEYGGFLYAFLASEIGNKLLWKLATGGVQPYITDGMLANIPVPIFPEEKQEQIHNLITEAAQLRVEANRLLEEAVEMLSNFIGLDFQEKEKLSGKVSLKEIYQSLSTRIDPPTFINNGVKAMEIIRDSGRELVSLSEIDGITVYRPGIFKRNYVEKGLPYIKGSELFNINPFVRCDNLSKTKTPFVDEMALKENQILITCAGSCGLVKVITKEYEEREAIGSQDIIRLQSENVLFTSEYLFVYLQLPFVYDYIQSMKYGSVIERIEPFHVQSIPVVVPTEELSANITSLITNYKNNVYQAFSNENQAISLVENEIALWQS